MAMPSAKNDVHQTESKCMCIYIYIDTHSIHVCITYTCIYCLAWDTLQSWEYDNNKHGIEGHPNTSTPPTTPVGIGMFEYAF